MYGLELMMNVRYVRLGPLNRLSPALWIVWTDVAGTFSITSIWSVFSAVTSASSFEKYWSPRPSMCGGVP